MNSFSLSNILINIEEVGIKAAGVFVSGYLTQGIKFGTFLAVNEVAKFILGKIIKEVAQRANLKSSTIIYIQGGVNLLIDASYYSGHLYLGVLTVPSIVYHGGFALARFYYNIKLGNSQRLVDYPFSAQNFNQARQ